MSQPLPGAGFKDVLAWFMAVLPLLYKAAAADWTVE